MKKQHNAHFLYRIVPINYKKIKKCEIWCKFSLPPLEKENGMTDEINLKAVIDGGDDGNPVLTIMKENED